MAVEEAVCLQGQLFSLWRHGICLLYCVVIIKERLFWPTAQSAPKGSNTMKRAITSLVHWWRTARFNCDMSPQRAGGPTSSKHLAQTSSLCNIFQSTTAHSASSMIISVDSVIISQKCTECSFFKTGSSQALKTSDIEYSGDLFGTLSPQMA